MIEFRVGYRVYYRDNGTDDLGTVTYSGPDGVYVEWDDDIENDFYNPGQLGLVE